MNYRPTITKPAANHPWKHCAFLGKDKKRAVQAHGWRQRMKRKVGKGS